MLTQYGVGSRSWVRDDGTKVTAISTESIGSGGWETEMGDERGEAQRGVGGAPR